MDFALWNLVDEADAVALADLLRADGMALREFDTAGVADRQGVWDAMSEALGFDGVRGWDSLADHLWTSLLPDDDEGDRVAVLWHRADVVVDTDLASFLHTLDILATTGREAYRQGLVVVSFLLGSGPNFPPLDQ